MHNAWHHSSKDNRISPHISVVTSRSPLVLYASSLSCCCTIAYACYIRAMLAYLSACLVVLAVACCGVQLDSRHIRVDRAGQSAHGSAGGNVVYERSRTVFVGNLPFDVEVRP